MKGCDSSKKKGGNRLSGCRYLLMTYNLLSKVKSSDTCDQIERFEPFGVDWGFFIRNREDGNGNLSMRSVIFATLKIIRWPRADPFRMHVATLRLRLP